ncbi:MAG: RnfABCDGE type electron transport complex subunit B [Clostridia bacterium]|nr:RnfABCDGE type electron transport complex subunit B [Clostridia bacterium]
MEFAIPILLFVGLALFAGIVLTVMARKFPGETTDVENSVLDALPGLNCGACGYAGCGEYAHSIVASNAPINACIPGGEESARKISEITGSEFTPTVSIKAFVRCMGSYDVTSDKYDYRGVLSCAASAKFYGGRSSCRFGCLGFGDCQEVCPNKAIKVENGCARVNPSLCTGCMLCASKCPKNLIVPVPSNQRVITSCSSEGFGKEVMSSCKNGCIACKKCVKLCPNGAIEMKNNLPVINSELCDACGKCAEGCPTKALKLIKR